MPIWLRLAFGLVVLALIALAHLYLFRRLVRDVSSSPWIRKLAALGLVLLGAVAVSWRALFLKGGANSQVAAFLAALWVGWILYLLAALVLADAGKALWAKFGTTASDPSRRLFLARGVAVGSVAASSSLTAYGTYRAYADPDVSEVHVRLPGLPQALEGFTLVQLSDLHIGPIIREAYVDRWVELTNAQKPDLVAITGDLVDGHPRQLGDVVARLGSLRARFGTAVVTGNHDYYSGVDPWVALWRRWGFHVLRNQRVSIGDGSASLDLLGVDDWGSPGMESDYDLGAALLNRDPDRASVLLAHQPTNLEAVAQAGIGLQLSGHTHGGQMFPGTWIGDAVWHQQNHGMSTLRDTQIYVSRGCGFVGPPLRLGAPPELVKIVLTRGYSAAHLSLKGVLRTP